MEEEKREKKKSSTEKLRENPWILSTVVLAIFAIVLIFTNTFNLTGNIVSSNDAGQGLLTYLESMGYSGFEISEIEEVGAMYLVIMEYNGEEIPFYLTKEGYLIGNSLVSVIPEEKEAEGVTQTEVPEAELYIWSYCPYGVTALAPFAQVAELLGEVADFKVYLYYAGHGEYEEQQNKIQACIQNLGYGAEYWEYAQRFSEEVYPEIADSTSECYKDSACDLKMSIEIMDEIGIDSNAVLTCVSNEGSALFEADYAAAKEAGVSGSPTLMINGIKISASRTAESYKGAVCEAFLDVPELCATTLSSEAGSTSGSC